MIYLHFTFACYSFIIIIMSQSLDTKIDLSILLTNPSLTTIKRLIGDIYAKGIISNADNMLLWYKQAADAGDPKAQYLFAKKTIFWAELPHDWTKSNLITARKYLFLAAENNYADAQYDLVADEHVTDINEKIKWLTLAAEKNHIRAC